MIVPSSVLPPLPFSVAHFSVCCSSLCCFTVWPSPVLTRCCLVGVREKLIRFLFPPLMQQYWTSGVELNGFSLTFIDSFMPSVSWIVCCCDG
ncbi:hypothetical protein K1719_022913 [Acacia pycnantha]|nr:hypothetical protein K1719_022913 [Acacia pycnantha]